MLLASKGSKVLHSDKDSGVQYGTYTGCLMSIGDDDTLGVYEEEGGV